MKILNNVFSIINDDKHKIITILGFKMKLKREKKYILEHIFCFFVKKFCKVKKNKVVIVNMTNWQYACNPKYIANELISRKDSSDLDLVWIIKKKTDTSLIPSCFRLVNYNSIKALYEFMTAGVWITNAQMLLVYQKGMMKNSATIHFQTHHGSMGIKKIDADATKVYGDKLGWEKWQKISAKTFDYLLVDSEQEINNLTSAHWGYGKPLRIGKARDSIFYKNSEPYIEKVKDFYSIPQENKILLYAPTWRSDKRLNCYGLDIKLLKRVLKNKFGGDWSILIRGHYHTRKNFPLLYDMNTLIDATDYVDMQELLVAADILISDYSSCIPEYAILKKPSFIFATDLQDYRDNENSFYFPLETLPSPIATDNGELAENILNFDNDKFVARCNEFLQEMGHEDDENSCKRIVDFILEKMNER